MDVEKDDEPADAVGTPMYEVQGVTTDCGPSVEDEGSATND